MKSLLTKIILNSSNHQATNLKNWLEKIPIKYRQHSSIKKIVGFISNKSKQFVREASECNKKQPPSYRSLKDGDLTQNHKYFYKELKNTFLKQSQCMYEGVENNLFSKAKETTNLKTDPVEPNQTDTVVPFKYKFVERKDTFKKYSEVKLEDLHNYGKLQKVSNVELVGNTKKNADHLKKLKTLPGLQNTQKTNFVCVEGEDAISGHTKTLTLEIKDEEESEKVQDSAEDVQSTREESIITQFNAKDDLVGLKADHAKDDQKEPNSLVTLQEIVDAKKPVANTKPAITIQAVAEEFRNRINAKLSSSEQSMKNFVYAEKTDAFKKYSVTQPNLYSNAAYIKFQQTLLKNPTSFVPQMQAEPSAKNVTLVMVNGVSKEDTKYADLFVIPSEKAEPERTTSWEKRECLNPNCVMSACPTYLKTQMEIYQSNLVKQDYVITKPKISNSITYTPNTVEIQLPKNIFTEEISDEQQYSSITRRNAEDFDNKPIMIIKLILNPNLSIRTDTTTQSPTAPKNSSLSLFKVKPTMMMKVMVPTPQKQEIAVAPEATVMEDLLKTNSNSFLALDEKRKRNKIYFFLKFPFYCDDSCLDSNSVCKKKGNQIFPECMSKLLTPVREYHTFKLPVTGICTWNGSGKKMGGVRMMYEFLEHKMCDLKTEDCSYSVVFTFKSKKSADECETAKKKKLVRLSPTLKDTKLVPVLKKPTINAQLLKWNLPDAKKTKSLSGKQIAYQQLDGSKITRLIRGTKVVAKNIYTRLSKKRGNYFDNDK